MYTILLLVKNRKNENTEGIHDIYIPKFKLILHNSCHNSLQYLHPVQTLKLIKMDNFVSPRYVAINNIIKCRKYLQCHVR